MSTISASTTTTTAYKVTADTTGTLVLQTGATPTTAVTIGSDQSVTFAGAVSLSGNQTTTGNLTVNGNTTLGDASTDTILMTGAPSIGGAGLGMGMGFRNRIINGAMVIDQRNAGAVLTPASEVYTLDRWLYGATVSSKFTVQQNAGSVTPPAGFSNYLGATSTSAYALTGNQSFSIQQRLEGFNTADFNFGTASAINLTLSFWVRSSLTGTFGGEIFGNPTRTYPFTYSIPTANTWTYITIAIAGDTTVNTYNTTTGFSLIVVFGLGASGTASGGTVNTWQNGNFTQPAGTVSVVSTNAATWYVTGVQLEKGSTATSFDYRPYGTELALCQRYYQTFQVNIDANATGASVYSFVNAPWQATMRATPTIVYGAATGGSANYSAIGAGYSSAIYNGTQLTSSAAGRYYYLCANTVSTASAEL